MNLSPKKLYYQLLYRGKKFRGAYFTFKEVREKYHLFENYETDMESKTISERIKEFKAMDRREEPIGDPSRFYLLRSVVSILNKKEPIILDIGGGLGYAMPYLAYACPNQKPKLVIYEQKKIVEVGNRFLSRKNVEFIDNIDYPFKVDVVFFGSSLQYFENYNEILKKVALFRPKYIIVSHIPMSNHDFVTAQFCGGAKGYIFPVRVIEKFKFKDFMKSLKYILINNAWEWIEGDIEMTSMVFRLSPG